MPTTIGVFAGILFNPVVSFFNSSNNGFQARKFFSSVSKNENKGVSNEEEVEYICKIDSYIYIFDGRETAKTNHLKKQQHRTRTSLIKSCV